MAALLQLGVTLQLFLLRMAEADVMVQLCFQSFLSI